MATYDPNGPAPFAYPLLVVEAIQGETKFDLWIDVAGQIDFFITADKQPTALLEVLFVELMRLRYIPVKFYEYTGSGGATHFWRNGYFFAKKESPPLPMYRVTR